MKPQSEEKTETTAGHAVALYRLEPSADPVFTHMQIDGVSYRLADVPEYIAKLIAKCNAALAELERKTGSDGNGECRNCGHQMFGAMTTAEHWREIARKAQKKLLEAEEAIANALGEPYGSDAHAELLKYMKKQVG